MGQGRAVAVGLLSSAIAVACSNPRPAPQLTPLPPVVPAAKVEPRMQGSPAVQPFLRLRVVEEDLARGNAQNAAAVASEIIAVGETSSATTSATTSARLRLPAIYAQLGDRSSADAAWQQAMLIPIDELTEEDFVALGTALAKNGRDDLAIKTRMRLLTDYTQGRFTEQTYGFLRNEVMKLPESDQLAIAKQLARYDRYDQALEILDRLTRTDEVRNARLRALFNSRHYEQLLEETKDTKLDDPALALMRARAAWRADRRPEFLAGLDAVNTPEANLLRSKYYTTDEIDYPRALDNLEKAIDAGALGTDGENLWSLGYTYVLAGKYQEALQTFDRYIAAYPDGDWKTNSLFWSAKILDRAGRTAERDAKARQILDEYPFSYYSYRAKELWSDVGAAALSGTATAEGSGRHMEFPDIATLPDEPRLAVVRELLDLGLARDATREMKLIAAKYPDHPAIQFMLADVYVQGGEPLKANGVLQRRFRQFVRHGGANIPRRFWEILFPLPHWDVIQKEAEKRALDPYLIASIIRQESAFEPSTVSNAGAVGLMQIMPEEASRIAGMDITRESLFDPATNIGVGAAEYSQKLAIMNGNPTLAVAAYNAGEDAVRGWTSITPLDDIDLFIESIPFAETRLYVKTVNRNRNEYRRIYER